MTIGLDPRLTARVRWISRTAGLAAALLGLLILVARVFGLSAFLAVGPGFAAMKTNVALGIVIAGLFLWRFRVHQGRRARWARRTAGLLIGVVGLLTLSQYLFGWDLGIDQLLFRVAAGSSGIFPPGRMSPAAAVSLALLGVGLLLLEAESNRALRAVQAMGLTVVFLAFIRLVGYAYGVSEFYGLASSYAQMSIHASIAFILLGLGVFLARPDRGIAALLSMRCAAGVMARSLLPAGVAVPVLLGWLERAGEQTELYPRGFGLSLLVVANVLVVSALVSIVARRLGRLEEERSRAFENLRCAESRYRGVLEASPDAVICATAGGEISVVNAQAERLFRYDRAELLGKPIETLLPESMRDRHRPLRKAYCSAPAARPMNCGKELMARRSDGTEFPAEISLSPLETAEGLTVVSTVRDITERQQIEERLRQSEKMEAVGRLASGVAHDFNNLLSVVIGYGDMLLRGLPDGDRRRGTVEQILQAGYRAATLTQQLLAYGRRQVSQPRVVDLNSIVLDMGKMLRRVVGEQIELDTDLDPKLGRVKMDQAQMEQVVMNLVINARDAMPDGGRLLIETRNARLGDADVGGRDPISPGLYVMVAVTDTGVGMDAATQARIFEPFFTTKEEGKGTGLGLATVYANVRQGDGDIRVRSEPGRGTTFKVYLPRVEDAAETVRPTAAGSALPRGTETILLVEDEEMVRRLVRSVLEASGYRILEAGGPLEAIRLLGEHAGPIHLLVTDVIMPGMTGSELAGKIVGLSPGMKVMYMSGYAGDAIAKHGVIGPGIIFLQKPFTPDALVRKVREVLDSRTEGRA